MFNKWREAAKNFAVPAPPTAPPTPLHHWKLDEGRGDYAYDTGTSATKAPLKREGEAEWLGGGGVVLPNNAGQNSFLDLGYSGITFAAAGGVTFAVWAKVESFQNSYGMILSLRDRSLSNFIVVSQPLEHLGHARDRARVYIKNGGSGKEFVTPDCNPNDRPSPACFFTARSRWVHVALTVTADGAWTLYRDGATQDYWKTDSGYGPVPNPNSIPYTSAALGRYHRRYSNDVTFGDGGYLNGSLRDARLYDTALGAAEIQHIFDYTKRG